MKAVRPDAVGQRIGERDERHPDVMGHVVANDGESLAGLRSRVVECVVKPIFPKRTRLHASTVAYGASANSAMIAVQIQGLANSSVPLARTSGMIPGTSDSMSAGRNTFQR